MMRASGGFTLIEIMMAVGIIGVLASALAVPAFVRARNTSQTEICVTNQRLIEDAKATFSISEAKTGDYAPTMSELQPYTKRNLACPASGEYRIGVVTGACWCTEHDFRSSPH